MLIKKRKKYWCLKKRYVKIIPHTSTFFHGSINLIPYIFNIYQVCKHISSKVKEYTDNKYAYNYHKVNMNYN